MAKTMIVSIGGNDSPLLHSLLTHHPEFVSFIAAQADVDAIVKLRSEAAARQLTFKSEVTLVDNIYDPQECIEKAREAFERVASKGISGEEILVDYTGGSKHLSVALALVATNRGYSFTHSEKEDTAGKPSASALEGRVSEEEQSLVWNFADVHESKQILILFNHYQFKAIKDVLQNMRERGVRNESFLRALGLLADGLYQWDLFRHREAADSLRKARISELREVRMQVIRDFVDDMLPLLPFIDTLAAMKQLGPYHILDLYANAERRFEEGSTDDAVLRLYRVVEMISQERLLTGYGIDSADVKADNIPDSLKEDFVELYKDPRDGKIRFPLSAGFRLLRALGDKLGDKFSENESRFRDLQISRNYSYLAHGIRYSKDTTYRSLREFILNLEMFRPEEAPQFPKFRLSV